MENSNIVGCGGINMILDEYTKNIILSSSKYEKEKEYWLKKLNREFSFCGFPYDYYDVRKKTKFSSVKKEISPELSDK